MLLMCAHLVPGVHNCWLALTVLLALHFKMEEGTKNKEKSIVPINDHGLSIYDYTYRYVLAFYVP